MLLLLDEVLAGLNPTEIEHMIGVIRRIRERGVTILIIEHLMQAIMSSQRPHRRAQLPGRSWPRARPPRSPRQSAVIEAYLGDPALAQHCTAGADMSDALLQVEALDAGYGEVQVLWGISLAVPRGPAHHHRRRQRRRQDDDAQAVIGSIAPWAGRVTFEGEDVTRLPPHAKAARGLVLVPEGRQLFGAMTVEENLEMGAYSSARVAQIRAAAATSVFTLFPRLTERRRQRAGTFSGGEQQMLAIARGLMSDPDILIIDELSLGLAPVVVHQLFGTSEGAQEAGPHHPAGRAERASGACRSATTPMSSPRAACSPKAQPSNWPTCRKSAGPIWASKV